MEINKIIGKEIIKKLEKIEFNKKHNLEDYRNEPLYINNVELRIGGEIELISAEFNDGAYFYINIYDVNIATFFIYFDKEYEEEKLKVGLSFTGIEF